MSLLFNEDNLGQIHVLFDEDIFHLEWEILAESMSPLFNEDNPGQFHVF